MNFLKNNWKQISVVLVLFLFWFILIAALNKTKSTENSSKSPINGIYLYISAPEGLIIEPNHSITRQYNPTALENCKKEDNDWIFNPKCCCTHNWCHRVPCSSIKFNEDETITVILNFGDHPKIVDHQVVWNNVSRSRMAPSPDADKKICYICASGNSLSCVFFLPGGIM